MKQIKFWACGAICFVSFARTPFHAHADLEPNAVTVRVPTPPNHAESAPVVRHTFGGQAVELSLVVEGTTDQPIDVRARLVQLSVSLGAPFYENELAVVSGLTLVGQAPATVNFSLPLPQVRDETEFELVIQSRVAGGDWFVAGQTKFRLYAKTILSPLKAISQQTLWRLRDDGELLKTLLDGLEVETVDYRAPVPGRMRPVVTLIVADDAASSGATAAAMLGRKPRGNECVIVFRERVGTLPRVVKSPWLAGQLVDVELKLLGRLEHDPRAQKVFLEIIELALGGQQGES